MVNRLYYTKKAKNWEEALPVGNGRIGAMVFGDFKKERIALNEDTLWSGYPKHNNNPDAHKYLDDIRKAVFEGNHSEAKRINNENIRGFWSDCYLPFGDLIIDYKNALGCGYSRTLDLANGIAVAQNNSVCQTVFVSHPAQLMVVNIKSEKGVSFTVKFDSQLQHTCSTKEDSLVINGKAPEICQPPYYHTPPSVVQGDKGMEFCGVVKVLGNAKFENDAIVVENQKDTTLLVSLATSFIDFNTMPTADAVARAYGYFENSKCYGALLDEHKADFSSLFNRVDLDLGSERADVPTDKRLKDFQKGANDNNLIALLFQFGRYLTISCSRPGTTCTNLQGIFNQHMRAPWSSNYTTNINTEMNYWCTDICNLSECFEPFVDLVKNLCKNGADTAKAYYNCNGAVAHHNVDIWAQSCPAGDPVGKSDTTGYAMWSTCLPWMLCQAYEHYRYTLDEDYINDLKPCFEQVLTFYKEYLVEHEGNLVTCPNISPENTYIDGSQKANLTYMPTMDIGILQEFFADCRELGFDTPQIQDIPIGSDGRIMEWCKEYGEAEKEHRHVSHLYCVYPSAIEQSDEVNKACEKSLLARGFGGTGWALGWKVCLWARLGNAENTLKLIKNQLYPIGFGALAKLHHGGGSYPNMFDAHPPFQIDGNFGVSAGIAELFKNKVVPKEWNGYAKGIKLYGGKILNIEFSNGEVKEC